MGKLNVKSTYPVNKPAFNEWCEMFKVSTLYIDRSGYDNAQRIMELWDGFAKTKQYFIKRIKIEEI